MEYTEPVSVIGITVALTQVFKGLIPKDYIPVLAVIIGILVNVAQASAQGSNLYVAAYVGAGFGLSAVGVYDVGKGIQLDVKKENNN